MLRAGIRPFSPKIQRFPVDSTKDNQNSQLEGSPAPQSQTQKLYRRPMLHPLWSKLTEFQWRIKWNEFNGRERGRSTRNTFTRRSYPSTFITMVTWFGWPAWAVCDVCHWLGRQGANCHGCGWNGNNCGCICSCFCSCRSWCSCNLSCSACFLFCSCSSWTIVSSFSSRISRAGYPASTVPLERCGDPGAPAKSTPGSSFDTEGE